MWGPSHSGWTKPTGQCQSVSLSVEKVCVIFDKLFRIGKCNHYMYRGEAVFFARFDGKFSGWILKVHCDFSHQAGTGSSDWRTWPYPAEKQGSAPSILWRGKITSTPTTATPTTHITRSDGYFFLMEQWQLIINILAWRQWQREQNCWKKKLLTRILEVKKNLS